MVPSWGGDDGTKSGNITRWQGACKQLLQNARDQFGGQFRLRRDAGHGGDDGGGAGGA